MKKLEEPFGLIKPDEIWPSSSKFSPEFLRKLENIKEILLSPKLDMRRQEERDEAKRAMIDSDMRRQEEKKLKFNKI